MITRLLSVVYCCLLLISCNNNTTETITVEKKDSSAIYNRIAAAKTKLQNGDLIERSDDDQVSNTLIDFSKKDKTFSHCGLVFFETGNYYVYHLMAGVENPSELMLREPYDSFVNPRIKTGLGIFRYALLPGEADNMHTILQTYYANKLPFDTAFDLSTDNKMYCAEMIYKTLLKATKKRLVINQSVLENINPKIEKLAHRKLKGLVYIGLDDLYLNAFTKEIDRVIYSTVKN